MHGDLGGAAADIKDQGMTNFELFSVLTHKRCPYLLFSKFFADLNVVKRDSDLPVRQREMGNSRADHRVWQRRFDRDLCLRSRVITVSSIAKTLSVRDSLRVSLVRISAPKCLR